MTSTAGQTGQLLIQGPDWRITVSLLALRLSVFLVMLMWMLDKLINPDHAVAIFAHFYGLSAITAGSMKLLAIVELIVILAFVAGTFRRWSYGAVLIFHAVSTFASYEKYLSPWDGLLFFAAWPMLAACLTLFLLRDYDRLFSVEALLARDPQAR